MFKEPTPEQFGFPKLKINEWGTKKWLLNGKTHREEGPAVEFTDGTKYWYINGKEHREDDLPAVEHVNGTKKWFLNGKLHRINGPAIEWSNGVRCWYLNGQHYSEEDFMEEVKDYV